ncbi:hypothetical protein SUGI_0481670 [Cryptomeria japonica]|uniref:uncharacterized protein LOC131030184 isoform X1 n=1 Tax=Cryptomeria japonica TaxID=3369 RepID=UPI002408BF5F|nr:uncharacterized protein LOC131030184 isoform X1 [Cryptomeria japonica]GLJ25182.1 hypothetical protein SUGI_0481670 [Cryptomeria japonica]
MCNKVARGGEEHEQDKGKEEEATNLAGYSYSGLTREREMSVMVSALSDVVAGTTGVKREREDVDEIQPSVHPRANPPLSLPPAMDFNLHPPWSLQLSYPSMQHHYYGAQIPITAPPTAAMMPALQTFLGFLMIMIVVENILKNFSHSGYQIVAGLAILYRTFNIAVVLNAEMDNMGQIEKALGCTPLNISFFVSLISIRNFLGGVIAGFLMQKDKFPMPLMLIMKLLIACVEHVVTAFALPGSLYVASIVIGLSFGAQWPKSLRSSLVSGLHFTNRKWREMANKGEGQNKVLKHLPCCGYRDLKEASLLTRNVTQRRLFVVFICFLIMSPAEGASMRGILQYAPAVHSERTAAVMEDLVSKPRKLSEPSKPQIDRGRGAQHN